MENLDELARLAALASLNKMLKQKHFDICVVRDIGDLFGIPVRNTEEYQILHTVHCLDYRDMPKQLREAIPGMVRKILQLPPTYDIEATEVKVTEVAPEKASDDASIWKLVRKCLPMK